MNEIAERRPAGRGHAAVEALVASAFVLVSSACGSRTALESLGASASNVDAGPVDGGTSFIDAGSAVDGSTQSCEAKGVVTLASFPGLRHGAIAVDDANVYWADGPVPVTLGRVMSVPKCGGAAVVLAGQTVPADIATDGKNVYWTNGGGTVMSVPVGGGAAVTLASGLMEPGAIALDDANVYWANPWGDQAVRRVSKAGGAVSVVVSHQPNPGWIGVDATRVYWMGGGDSNGPASIRSIAKQGGAVVSLVTFDGVHLLHGPAALDSERIYFASNTLDSDDLVTVPLGGGPQTTLASVPLTTSIAVDATDLYFLTLGGGQPGAGTLGRVPKAGGAPVILASGLTAPIGLVVDATSVYWLNGADDVMKLAK